MIKRTVLRTPTSTTTRRPRTTSTTTILPKPFKHSSTSKTTTRKNSTTTTRSEKANKLAKKIAKPGIGVNRWRRLMGNYREEMNKNKKQ
jgi:hypothetical protein